VLDCGSTGRWSSPGGRRGGITTLDLTDEAERTQIRPFKEKLGKRSLPVRTALRLTPTSENRKAKARYVRPGAV
jgi:hypothetical protein